MSLSIKEVVNAQIMPQAMAARRRDLSMIAIFTPEIGNAFTDDTTRYVIVSGAQGVANLFGTQSETYKAALSLFSVRPTPKRALIGRWAKTKQEIPATANALKGSTISVGINAFKAITDGSMKLNVGSKIIPLSGLDFSKAIDFTDIATVLQKALPENNNLTVTWDTTGHRVIIQAQTAGAYPATKLGYVTDPNTGTYIGNLLKLQDGQATIVIGKVAVSIEQELPSEALHKLQNVYQDWYGVYFADAITDEQLDDMHTWIAAADMKVGAYTALRDELLDWNNENILKKLYDKNSGRLMVEYNKTGNDHAAVSLLGISLSTNWNAQNSAKTVKFKQQTAVRSDDRITLSDAEKCRRLGVNFYTDYDGVSMIAEGVMLGGVFIDETVGLDAFLDACQKQAFTTLQANPTKIPQTDKGQAMLIGALTVIGNEFVRNGFLAGGLWRGNDIGELTYGDRLDEGFYFYSDSYDLQSLADRESRKAMPIMCAIKLAGAIHSVDLLIQFNR
ncbi:DUF3383 domain-containing protein [Xenorhabdus griffiniae]|uniref:DUF3383 domain-containing protein n=1 Tax=Xenorhabdus griffiniae TaxID=351672 RepID=A0ABY9XE86_9GAMM|nr:DUF3383 domain-containing protein [Xenorhabdus griffiniae]MBD1228383.1 DUF3383 domain-containing protein [Xenorhabdus griffiniae]MBE8587964.1 DUF3383 domain-containing protein [Xenorhabdus griffiniae]WMV71234.1 DUF3383 domain-containing protein [Xenorhabdus griffiniae]WNH00910.1 DUF3383 domain-containing protein [Xenorhabdus griffiniae]